MDFVKQISIDKCRLCQDKLGTYNLRGNCEFEQKISKCLNFEVDSKINVLPSSVCDYCKNKIEDIFDYISKIKKINDRLLQLASDLKDEENKSFKENTVSCEFCLQQFENHDLHSIHLNEHDDIRCLVCAKVFNGKNRSRNYKSHLKKKHGFYCIKCDSIFDDENLLSTHKCISEHIEEAVINNENRDEFNKRKSIGDNKIKTKSRSHKRSSRNCFKSVSVKPDLNCSPDCISKNDPFRCLICGQDFLDKNVFDLHKNTHKNLNCPKENCDKICPSSYSLKIHILSHEGKRPYLCVTCGKGFMTKNSLSCHEKIHLDVKSYHCKECNIGFSVKSNFRAHEKKYHEGHRFYCSQCTKEFLTKCSLDRHEKIHAGVKEFKCEHCASAFYTNKELIKHQRYHQGLKRHKCQECFKTFFERHHLVIHLRSHTGERPYKCKIPGCSKSFVDSQKLKRHHSSRHTSLT